MPVRMSKCGRRVATALVAAIAIGTGIHAQIPPPLETDAYVLVDVGPVPVPVTCPCIANPFKVPRVEMGVGSGPAGPQPFGPPSKADIDRRDRQRAEDQANFKKSAEDALAGNDAASFGMGVLFMEGQSVRRDDVRAAQWFHLAAAQGHRDAALQLGHRYHRGLGVQQSDESAAYWFGMGARGGERLAMVALGLSYAAGRGVPQDWPLAAAWWEEAAAAGTTPLASRMLGDAYMCGLGVRQDYGRAERAYTAAAAAGETSASVQLGHLYSRQCVPAGKPDAAYQAYKTAADEGNVEAQTALSALYFEGRGGVDQDAIQSLFWATMARLRAPDGELRNQAEALASRAARQLPAYLVEDTEQFVRSMIEANRSRRP
jgi:TPR repeat protein